MPTLKRFGAASIRMYADDHNPPQFHVVSEDFQVLVRLSDFRVIAGEARAAQLAEALAWARQNRDMLVLTWSQLNARG